MNYQGVWHTLDNSVPPEITHYQMGQHPGTSWWLKTVIPSNDQSLLHQAWDAVARKHPRLVCLEPHAYDWQQNLITGAHSIWLNYKIDVVLTQVDSGYQYEMGDYDTSFNKWGDQILQQLNQHNSDQIDPNDWHMLTLVADLMKSWTTDRQARNNRRSLQIVSPEKNKRSVHNRSKLDPG